MRKLNVNQMEQINGLARPKCTYEYASFWLGAWGVLGAAGVFVFGGAMLYCE